jgi:hypothetical protein
VVKGAAENGGDGDHKPHGRRPGSAIVVVAYRGGVAMTGATPVPTIGRW